MGFNASPSITGAKELISPERGESKQNTKIEKGLKESRLRRKSLLYTSAPGKTARALYFHCIISPENCLGSSFTSHANNFYFGLPPMMMSGLSPCSGSPALTKNPESVIGPDFCGG